MDYVTGDATAPIGGGRRIIVHICNNRGGWGRGFVEAVSRRWPTPERIYREHFRKGECQLGAVQFVIVEAGLIVANCVAQDGYKSASNPHPLSKAALIDALDIVAAFARHHGASIHMPRIGAGLGGGNWLEIEELINDCLQGLNVTVYSI